MIFVSLFVARADPVRNGQLQPRRPVSLATSGLPSWCLLLENIHRLLPISPTLALPYSTGYRFVSNTPPSPPPSHTWAHGGGGGGARGLSFDPRGGRTYFTVKSRK